MDKKVDIFLTPQERKDMRDKKIRKFYKEGHTMEQLCTIFNVSKTTVFFAIKGRSKKKAVKG